MTYQELKQLIDAFRAETQPDSITPDTLGQLIQKILDYASDEENIQSGLAEIIEKRDDALEEITSLAESSTDSIDDAKTEAMQEIEETKDAAVASLSGPVKNYLQGDVRTLAIGQTYQKDEAVKTSDGAMVRLTKEVKAMNTTDAVVKGDLKTANSKTWKALKAISAYNGNLSYSSGSYALGRPAIYTLTVDVSGFSTEGNVSVSVGDVSTGDIAVDSESTAASVAAAIVTALGTITGWQITDNEDGTITIACLTGGANTLTITSDVGGTGVVISSSSVAGAATTSKYDGTSWSAASVADMYGDSSLYEEVAIASLTSGYTSQNNVTKDMQSRYAELSGKINEQDDLYNEVIMSGTYSANAYGYVCVHTHCYNGYVWTACCTNTVFRLFRNGTQVKTVNSRNLTGVFVTDGYCWYLSETGILYRMDLNSYTESSVASFTMPTKVANACRFYASFCIYNNYLHFVLSERYNTTPTVVRLYRFNGSSVQFVNNVVSSGKHSGASITTDGTYMYATFIFDRGNSRIYRCDSSYTWSLYSYPIQLQSGEQNTTSDISIGNKYPIVARGSVVTLWNNDMPVRISLDGLSGGACRDISMEFSGNYIYLATYRLDGNNAVIKVVKLRKDFFDNFFDNKSYNEIHITAQSQLAFGQTGIMSYVGKVSEYSTGTGTGLRNRYAPFGVKDTFKVKGTGTSYRKRTLVSQGNCKHEVRVFTARAEENVFKSVAFRIPTICTYDNVLYAACSARLTSAADTGPANTVFAKSLDGGITWQDYTTVTTRVSGGADVDGNVYVCGGGAKAGRLWVFTDRYDNTSNTRNENYKFVGCYSDDKGLTWSEPVDYQPAVIAAAASKGVTAQYCRTSNGSGVTLANGTLAITIGLILSGRHAAALWYTTDGTNWQLGDILPNDESNESALTLVGSDLYMTYRMNSSRGFAKLTSIGSGWTKITTAVNPNSNSSNLTVGWGYCNGVFLLSCPASTKRNNISLYKSRDLVTWEKVIQLTTSNSNAANLQGYTCMVFTKTMLKIFVEMKSDDQHVFDLDYLLPYIFG